MNSIRFRRTAHRPVRLAAMTIGLALATVALAGQRNGPSISRETLSRLFSVETDIYMIYSDLGEEQTRAMTARVDAFYRDLNARYDRLARSRKIKRFPVFLIQNEELYKTLGGEAAGVTWGDRIVVKYTDTMRDEFWHCIQHELFHEFAHHQMMGQNGLLPGWLDEGLAEYHGESLWTGDGFQCGIVSKVRRVRGLPKIREGSIVPFAELCAIRADAWSGIEKYDQALAMMHYFYESENTNLVRVVITGIEESQKAKPFEKILEKSMGRDCAGMQSAFVEWWKAHADEDLNRGYAKATVAALTGFLGRAALAGKRFASPAEFLAAARQGALPTPPALALPSELKDDALARADQMKWTDWTFEPDARNPKAPPKLVLKLASGPSYAGVFAMDLKGRPSVRVEERGAR